MHFRPLHDRVVVRRIEFDEKSAGGIIIPDTAKEKPQEGEVVAVGPSSVVDQIAFGSPVDPKWSFHGFLVQVYPGKKTGMCNLYSLMTNVEAIRQLFKVERFDPSAGNKPALCISALEGVMPKETRP